jgi:hypothetical protein
VLSDRAVLIVSYALSGFAHLASVGIFVGGTIALIPSRRKDISELGWKALFVGTLATMMIAAVAGYSTRAAQRFWEKSLRPQPNLLRKLHPVPPRQLHPGPAQRPVPLPPLPHPESQLLVRSPAPRLRPTELQPPVPLARFPVLKLHDSFSNLTKRFSLRNIAPSDRPVLVLGAVFFTITLLVTLNRYFSFFASYDQGIFNQVFWNGLHGRFFQSSLSSVLSSSLFTTVSLLRSTITV